MLEIWKYIPNLYADSQYEASNRGRIRGYTFDRWGNVARHSLIAQRTVKDYQSVWVRDKSGKGRSLRVHVLVALSFLGDRPTLKHEVNHKDLDKKNNCDWNLEWATHKKNMEHFYANGYDPESRNQKGEANSLSKLTQKQVDYIRRRAIGV